MSAKKPFQTTAVLHPDGTLEVMGGAMRHVKYEAAKTPGARAIVVREVVEPPNPKKCRHCKRPGPPASTGGECGICGAEDGFR